MGISSVSPFANFFVRQDFEDAPDELDAADVAHANWNARVADNSGNASADSAEAASGNGNASRRPCVEEIIRQTSREFEAGIAAARAKAAAASAPQAAASAPTNAANMSVSGAWLQKIKGFEGGQHLTAYQDTGGVWTIGYGHTGDVNGKPVTAGMTITQDQADQLLPGDLATAEAAVRNNVHVPITQGQFDALTDFTFNLGAGKLEGSTLLPKLNAKDYAGAQAEFGRWVYGTEKDKKTGKEVEVKLPGLVTRRAAEAALFGNTGPQQAAAPSAASSAAKAAGQ
jgi:GH24 family phage-related lysozyme (muramidase)